MARNEKTYSTDRSRLERKYTALKTAGILSLGAAGLVIACGLFPNLQQIYESLPAQPPVKPVSPLVLHIDTASFQSTLAAASTGVANRVSTIVAAATQTAEARPTNTPTPTPTDTPVPTNTLQPTATPSPSPTEDYSKAIATAVQKAAIETATTLASTPTNTPVPPTETQIPPTITATWTTTATDTPLPPTATFTLTPFPTSTPDICIYMAPAAQLAAGCPVTLVPTDAPPAGEAPTR